MSAAQAEDDPDPRTRELAERLQALEARVRAACAAAGRDRDDVQVIAVTKTWPAQDVRRLVGLGVLDVGENRDQEAAAKAAECADLPVRWHFVGQLQTNKAKAVAGYARVVHTLDRDRVVDSLARAADRAGREVQGLVQVSLDADPARGGAPVEQVLPLAGRVAAAPGLRLAGVMALAPLQADPAAAFARLASLASDLRQQYPDARWISAGMSGDLEQAVAAGATHLRVGTALLGSRPPLR
jgi:pyridoxal phosphate enzyme (YggS family)